MRFDYGRNMIMHIRMSSLYVVMILLGGTLAGAHDGAQKISKQKKLQKNPPKTSVVSYKKNVFPIIKMNCLPCHTEDQMNPSELYLDSYDNMLTGGKHGKPIIPGKADSSLIIRKIIPPPPFGDPMPMKRKTPIAADTINIIKKWIDQGAENN